MSDVDMSESTALPDPAQESPLDTASSSSSEAAEQVSLSTRLTTLAVLEQQIASLLTSAFQALDALNPAINPGDSAVASRSDHFSHHTEAYLDTLERTSAELKRSIRALEEEEIIDLPLQLPTTSKNYDNSDAVQKFLDQHKLANTSSVLESEGIS